MKQRLLSCLLICFSTLAAFSAETNSEPHSLPALQTAIESVLKETRTPGAAIAIVTSNKLDWLTGIGQADVAANLPVTPDTLFRLGSVSKGFVALAALQLQEAGKLKLTDPLRQWAPDVAFVNPWEATDPVRLVHLMEHTSGFEDMHLREYALDDPAITLDRALAYGASSRVCRWPPGERMAYCNSGPAVLAAVIEKVSGQPFEAYVQTNLFNPLHMTGASYFDTPEVERRLAKLYRPDGVTPYPYWHLGLRPTAGLNASARDMANYLRFYLQRGRLDGTQVLSAASLGRMERGETLPSAKLGRMFAYGLFNYDIPYGPFVFRGHNGAVMGCITEMAYLPEQGCGYVVMINSGSFFAAGRIADQVREYLRPKLTAPPLPPVVSVPAQFKQQYAGHYQYISPAVQWTQGIHRWLNPRTLTVTTNGFLFSFPGLYKQRVVPVTERLYRSEDESLATIALLPDTGGDIRIQCRMGTFQRIPAVEYWAQLAGIALVFTMVASSLVMAPIWIVRSFVFRSDLRTPLEPTTPVFAKTRQPFLPLPGGEGWGEGGLPSNSNLHSRILRRWLGKSRNPGPLSVRFLPLLSAALLAAFAGLIFIAFRGLVSGKYIDDASLGTPNLLTVSLWLASLGFPLAAAASLYVLWRERHTPMKRVVYWYSVLVALTMAAAAVYYGWWGLIGLRLWA